MKKINVALTDEKFKRLALKIKKALPSSGLKLGQVQEMVAQSFGFRNLSGLLSAMSDEEKMSQPRVGMERITKEKLLHLYEWFAPQSLKSSENGIWFLRSKRLVELVAEILIEKGVERNALFSEFGKLLSLHELYKLSEGIGGYQSEIKKYLEALPGCAAEGFQMTETVLEQHGYLKTQVEMVFEDFERIEKNNFLMFNHSWFEEVVYDERGKTHEVMALSEKTRQMLDEDGWFGKEWELFVWTCHGMLQYIHPKHGIVFYDAGKKELLKFGDGGRLYALDVLMLGLRAIYHAKKDAAFALVSHVLKNFSEYKRMSEKIESL